jgi:hypothetical protein
MAHRKSLIQVKFRFREDLLRRLEREAKRNDRSTNAEIAHRLEQSIQGEDQKKLLASTVEQAAKAAVNAAFSTFYSGPPLPLRESARDDAQSEPAKSAVANQKDSGT